MSSWSGFYLSSELRKPPNSKNEQDKKPVKISKSEEARLLSEGVMEAMKWNTLPNIKNVTSPSG